MKKFALSTEYTLKGDQSKAVEDLVKGIKEDKKHQVLLGVTGSGKTFSMANVIARLNRPTLIISPNKTLTGQLFNEFRELFPDNAVEYFVSYYDYYQPEAYVPASDTFIEKDASVNERIDRMRHSATHSLLTRRDVIVVASVSCIYGIGSPKFYRELSVSLKTNMLLDRDELLRKLVSMQYLRNDVDFYRGTFRVRGDLVDIYPASASEKAIRVIFFDDEIEKISSIDPLTGNTIEVLDEVLIFPASHYVTPPDYMKKILLKIEDELNSELKKMKFENKLLEAQRLEQRTRFDLEMMRETGFCSGIENYSRYMDGRKKGEAPSVLLNFFPDDMLLFIDESHITTPQIGGMYKGDQSRKSTLVNYGFRLPSALDNRPLNFNEFESFNMNKIYVSATPGDYEINKADGRVTEQLIRPTGLLDPLVEMKPTENQVDDLEEEIRKVIKKKERVLVTTLTKRMAEKLTDYYKERGLKAEYLHSDIQTIDRMKIIANLRDGKFDVLIGINLLREGLDIPEVSLIGVLEADQEGFLRSRRSLIQIFGRAARNVNGRVILYADKKTKSIKEALSETERRRKVQKQYNKDNNITPETIKKKQSNILLSIYEKDYVTAPKMKEAKSMYSKKPTALYKEIQKLKKKMNAAAKKYRFEDAAVYRDQISYYEEILDKMG